MNKMTAFVKGFFCGPVKNGAKFVAGAALLITASTLISTLVKWGILACIAILGLSLMSTPVLIIANVIYFLVSFRIVMWLFSTPIIAQMIESMMVKPSYAYAS